MSVSRHPVALQLERQVGGATKLLATVMALPLIDGIFAALVVAGVLGSPVGIVETGILIFGGSATIAVILAEMDGTRKEMVTSVLLIGAVILPVAAVEAAFAPTLRGVLNLAIFERFAGLVILSIAAKTASAKFGEYLPGPAVIIGLGLVASFDPSDVALKTSTEYVLNGTAAAGIGVGFALLVALLSPHLRGRVDIDRFRFGSAVALGVLALPILLRPFGLMQTEAPIALAVLAVTGLFAYDPEAEHVMPTPDTDAADAGADADAANANADTTPESASPEPDPAADSADAPAVDGPTETPLAEGVATERVSAAVGGEPGDDADDPFADDDSRAPWM